MSTKEQNVTEKQKKIVAAATELFAEKGYAATSTNEIAKKAEVAEGTIFRHYKSKKDLLLSIVSPTMIKIMGPAFKRDLNKVLDKEFATFQDFMRAMIANRIKFVRNNTPLLKIVMQELPFHEELKQQFIEHIGKDVFEKLRDIVVYFQEKGQIRDAHPDTIIRVAVSSIFSFIIARYVILPEINWDDEETEIERILEVLTNGIAKR